VLRYANSCRATSRSSSLDETGRLEIGWYERGSVGQDGQAMVTADEE